MAKSKKKAANRPGPAPGTGGRPPKVEDPHDRTIRLGASDWARMVKLEPHGSWADKIRGVLVSAEKWRAAAGKRAAKRRKAAG